MLLMLLTSQDAIASVTALLLHGLSSRGGRGRIARRRADAHVAEDSLVALLAGNVARRHPLAGGPGLEVVLAVHEVDVLERQAAGLVEEEPDEDAGGQIAGGKDVSKVVGDALVGEGAEETNEDC